MTFFIPLLFCDFCVTENLGCWNKAIDYKWFTDCLVFSFGFCHQIVTIGTNKKPRKTILNRSRKDRVPERAAFLFHIPIS